MSDAAILLLRHSPAGKRSKWDGDDTQRPLDKKGEKQASGLVATLAAYPISRICSSPYARCVQTVEPLSQKLGLPIDVEPSLAEGASFGQVVDFLESVSPEMTVACTHGDVMQLLVGAGRPMKKGGLWLLDADLEPLHYKSPV